MRQRVVNHKGADDWQDRGPCQPMPAGPTGEKHTKSAPVDEESIYGIYFSTPGHRPMAEYRHNDIETGYTQ